MRRREESPPASGRSARKQPRPQGNPQSAHDDAPYSAASMRQAHWAATMLPFASTLSSMVKWQLCCGCEAPTSGFRVPTKQNTPGTMFRYSLKSSPESVPR